MILLESKKKINNKLTKDLNNNVTSFLGINISISMSYVYFCDINSKFFDHTLFCKLLNADIISADKYNRKNFLLVTPRQGVETPWESKAKDIFYACGIKALNRLSQAKIFEFTGELDLKILKNQQFKEFFYDKMTEYIYDNFSTSHLNSKDKSLLKFDNINTFNDSMGLGLNSKEIEYLKAGYASLRQTPSPEELMMFGQVNSEHCRHKIFNSHWSIDGKELDLTMFDLIKSTFDPETNKNVIKAYSDNGAITSEQSVEIPRIESLSSAYKKNFTRAAAVIKAETHNHPTAISPKPGAATGSGGEIRDEAATGRGAKSKAGTSGYIVSSLNYEGQKIINKKNAGYPSRISNALKIMIDGPLGSSSFNNEFGRPCLSGFFRTLEIMQDKNNFFGFHKPLMIAGGLGQIESKNYFKNDAENGDLIIVLGGPAMLIGLGGGSSSSINSKSGREDLDFASVQRDNPEMQRRCQEVIDRCIYLDNKNPIVTIHDVGAGGLSNAIPEIINDSKKGGKINLESIPAADKSMNPLELWCNESQERYVLIIKKENLITFQKLCESENCPFSVVGVINDSKRLVLEDKGNTYIDIPMDLLFNYKEKNIIDVSSQKLDFKQNIFDYSSINLSEAVENVLSFPSVSSKEFLINIGDRSVGGLTIKDQFDGPWQVPVSNCSIISSDYTYSIGYALALGEKASVACYDPIASVDLAICESILNLVPSRFNKIENIVLSANWMSPFSNNDDKYNLYKMVERAAFLSSKFNISIPVGKDSLSMATTWKNNDFQINVKSPNTLVCSSFAGLSDLKHLPVGFKNKNNSSVIYVNLGAKDRRMGGSVISQIYDIHEKKCPKLDNVENFIFVIELLQSMHEKNKIVSYHDISDGGLLTTIAECCFAGHTGMSINIDKNFEINKFLFSEELGFVVQIEDKFLADFYMSLNSKVIEHYELGKVNSKYVLEIKNYKKIIYSNSIEKLHKIWHKNSFQIQLLRDNPKTSNDEFEKVGKKNLKGLYIKTNNNNKKKIINTKLKPKIAILKEQGVNGHYEMAQAFSMAGFDSYDVNMNSIIQKSFKLDNFQGVVFCGGFSFGDVLGAGSGWANKILHNSALKDEFQKFFSDQTKFSLGVCNGCQVLSKLTEIIPGSENWPNLCINDSERFESRYVMTKIVKSNSFFFDGMEGSELPIIVAHGEGKMQINNIDFSILEKNNQLSMRYIDNNGSITEKFPYNPNGSFKGITSVSSKSGNILMMMPHPERLLDIKQFPIYSNEKDSPWSKFFENAKKFVN